MATRGAAAACLCAAAVIDCSPALSIAPGAEAPRAPALDTVVLVTLDGVRRQEIWDGVDDALALRAKLPEGFARDARELTPNLHRLFFDEGVAIGDPRAPGGIVATGSRHMSMPGYVELTTGAATTCGDNACAPDLRETIADAAAVDGDRARVAVFGSWSEIARAAASRPHLITVETTRAPGEAGYSLPGGDGYRLDHGTSARALAHLAAHRPRFLWVALGDTDERAHAGDYRGYLEALREADRFVGDLARTLDAGGRRAAIFVTADHGRDPGFRDHGGPDSAAVWLLARGASIPRRGAIATASTRRLCDVAPTLRVLLGLPERACAACGEPIVEILAGP